MNFYLSLHYEHIPARGLRNLIPIVPRGKVSAPKGHVPKFPFAICLTAINEPLRATDIALHSI